MIRASIHTKSSPSLLGEGDRRPQPGGGKAPLRPEPAEPGNPHKAHQRKADLLRHKRPDPRPGQRQRHGKAKADGGGKHLHAGDAAIILAPRILCRSRAGGAHTFAAPARRGVRLRRQSGARGEQADQHGLHGSFPSASVEIGTGPSVGSAGAKTAASSAAGAVAALGSGASYSRLQSIASA